MSERILKGMFVRWFRGQLFGCAVAAVVVPGFGVAIVVSWIVAGLIGLPADLTIAGGMVLFALLAIGATALGVYLVIARRNRRLDAVFVSMGLEANTYGQGGRQYHGTIAGRQVDVFLGRGPILNVYVGTPVATRLGIALRDRTSRLLQRLTGAREIHVPDPDFARVGVYGRDPGWTHALLGAPAVKAAVFRSLTPAGSLEVRQVLFAPGAVHLQVAQVETAITPASAGQMINDLFALAGAAEALPHPAVVEQALAAEQWARSEHMTAKTTYKIAIAVFAVLMLGGGLAAGVIVLLLVATSR